MMTKTLFLCLSVCSCVVSHADELDSLAALDIPDQVTAIGQSLLRNAQPLADKTIDMQVVMSGIIQSRMGADYERDGKPGPTKPDVLRGEHKLRLITSQENGYEEYYLGSKFAINHFTKETSRTLLFDSHEQIELVSIFCSPPPPSLQFVTFLHTTLASGWRGFNRESDSKADLNEFIALRESANFTHSAIEQVDGLGRVLVLREVSQPNADDPHSLTSRTHYFGLVNDSLVYLGDDNLLQSMPPDGREYIQGQRVQQRLAYKLWDGHLMLNQWSQKTSTFMLDSQTRPLGTPFVYRDIRLDVKSCRILDSFPMEVLNIAIPASTKIVDHCKRSQQQDVAAVVENAPQRRRNWWLLAAGVTLIIGGASSWVYYRKIK